MINFTTPLWLFVILMLTLVFAGLMSPTYTEGFKSNNKAKPKNTVKLSAPSKSKPPTGGGTTTPSKSNKPIFSPDANLPVKTMPATIIASKPPLAPQPKPAVPFKPPAVIPAPPGSKKPSCPPDLTSELAAANSSYKTCTSSFAAYKIQAEDEKVSAVNSANSQCTNEKQAISDEYIAALNATNLQCTDEKQKLIDTAESAMSEATNNWTNERQSLLDSANLAMNKANKEYENELNKQINMAANNLAVVNGRWSDANKKLSEQISDLQSKLEITTAARDKCYIDRDQFQSQYNTCDTDRTSLQSSFAACDKERTGLNADIVSLKKMLADLNEVKNNLMRQYNFDCFPKSVAKNKINALDTQVRSTSSNVIPTSYATNRSNSISKSDSISKIDNVYKPVKLPQGSKPCPPGEYNSSTGETPCTKCAAGRYASNDYNFVCNKCPTGSTSKLGATKCVPIKADKPKTPEEADTAEVDTTEEPDTTEEVDTTEEDIISGFSNMRSYGSYTPGAPTFSKY